MGAFKETLSSCYGPVMLCASLCPKGSTSEQYDPTCFFDVVILSHIIDGKLLTCLPPTRSSSIETFVISTSTTAAELVALLIGRIEARESPSSCCLWELTTIGFQELKRKFCFYSMSSILVITHGIRDCA